MRVVQLIRRTNCQVVNLVAVTPHRIEVTIKPLEFGEEIGVREVTIHNANGVVRVKGRRQLSASFRYRPHVPRRDKSGGANQRVGLHLTPLFEVSRPIQVSYRTRGESTSLPSTTFSQRPPGGRI